MILWDFRVLWGSLSENKPQRLLEPHSSLKSQNGLPRATYHAATRQCIYPCLPPAPLLPNTTSIYLLPLKMGDLPNHPSQSRNSRFPVDSTFQSKQPGSTFESPKWTKIILVGYFWITII